MKAVLFDWGGTLTLWTPVEHAAVMQPVAEHVAPVLGLEVADCVKSLCDIELGFFRRAVGERRSFVSADVLYTLAHRHGVTLTSELVAEALAGQYAAYDRFIVHDPEARPTLEALRDGGYRLGLLSNTHFPAWFHDGWLARDDLDLFDATLYTSDVGLLKPEPSLFETLLARLDVSAREAIFVGDRQTDDVEGAQGVGMQAVWRRHPGAEEAEDIVPDYVIDALPELLALLAADASP